MDNIDPIGRLLVIAGLMLAGFGLLIVVAPNVPALGRLPGDIDIDRGNVQIYIPFGTMIVISLVLTVLLNVSRLFGRSR